MFLLLAGAASARVYCAEYAEGTTNHWCKNTDGTWSFWYYKAAAPHFTKKPTKVYTQSEYEKFARLLTGVNLDSGVTGNTGSETPHIGSSEILGAAAVYKGLDSHELYKDPAEKEIGESFVETSREIDTLPEADDALGAAEGACASGGCVIAAGVGTLALGVAIGTGIDEVFGLPSLIEQPEPPPVAYACEFYPQEKCKRGYEYKTYWKSAGKTTSCKTYSEAFSEFPAAELAIGKVGKCIDAGVDYIIRTKYYCNGGEFYCGEHAHKEVTVEEEHKNVSGTGGSIGFTFRAPQIAGPIDSAQEGEEAISKWTVWSNLTETSKDELAFPATELDELPGVNTGHLTLPEGPQELTPVLPKVAPEHIPDETEREIKRVPATIPEEIGHQREHAELPGVEGEELPDPRKATVPTPHGNELYTEYKTELEAAGLTNIEENILSETTLDPKVGPNDVADVAPAEGSEVDPKTEIRVDVNPATAPNPEGGGIAPPTEPGIKLPKLGVLCTNFPFGVPCWLAATIGSWSTTSEAPDWTIVPELEVDGHKTSQGKFNFNKLEGIMEVVRPAMALFAIIGIVLLFYNFAKGGGAPSGSSDDSSMSAQPEQEQWDYDAGTWK